MAIDNVLAGVAVTAIDASAQWYEKLLGRPRGKPMPELVEWKFTGGGGLQLFVDPGRAGQSSVTLVVSDLDACLARLTKKGLTTVQRRTSKTALTALLRDPDGNQVQLAQTLSKRGAR